MSEQTPEQPTTPPVAPVQPPAAAPAPQQAAPAQAAPQGAPQGAPQVPQRGPGGGKPRGFNRKPAFKPGPVPVITDQRAFGTPPKLSDLDAQIEGELQAAMEGFSGTELLTQEPRPAKGAAPAPAGGKKGKVMSIHGPDVFIDVPGGRSQGVLPLLQFPDGPPALGTEVDIHIEGYDSANGLLLLSRRGAAVADADWSSIAENMTVEARVTAVNKGGLEVTVNGIRAFMPISQIEMFRVENLDPYVNQRIVCLVTEVDPVERNLVVSRRALLEREREEQAQKLWQELAEGQVREGIVRSVRDFGAFVDLGGADGLLHVSEMSWNRVQDPNSVVQPGQRVRVVVLRVDHEKRKISLGLKQLQASPWDEVDLKFPHSTVVKGKVSRLADFGAFVELEPGIEGLIHISELAPQRVWRVADIVQVGQEVQVMVLSVDKEKRRMSLSLKAALPREEPKAEEEEEEEEVVEVKPPRPRTTPLRGGLGE
jgi:small subunit ribosomal protein S1